MKRCTIIANRGAGSFSATKLAALCAQIKTGGLDVEPVFCRDFDDMTAAAAVASMGSDSPIVVAAGGDGTINAVFNGLAGKNATCAILPMGTANVMALELGLKKPEKAASLIISGQARPFTAGLLKNSDREKRFFLMAGAGLDGHIVRGVSLKEKRYLGKGAYILSGLRSIISWDNRTLHVTTEKEEFSCSSLIVCNISRYGGSFLLAPSADLFSPCFEIFAIRGASRSRVLGAVAGTLLGRSGSGEVIRTTARRIRIEGVKPVQADGDDWGEAPVDILAETDYASIII